MDLGTGISGSNIMTLEPYLAHVNSEPKSVLEKKKERVENDNKKVKYRKMEILPGHYEVVNYEKFLILEVDNGRHENLNIFKANREIIQICGGQPKILLQGDGSLLIETSSPVQSQKLKDIKLLDGHNVKCVSHPFFNQCRGVVYAPEILQIEEKEIEEELKSQGIVKVVRMKKKVGEQLIPLATLILTFDQCRLPSFIKVGWLSIKVKPYIPSPLRCYHCQMYGHSSQKCKERSNGKPAICVNCGRNSHGTCHEAPCCIHCGEAHSAISKNCVKYIFEKEIQAIRAMEKVTFKEARRRALEKQIRPGVPFSLVLKRSNNVNENVASTSNEKPPFVVDESSDKNLVTSSKLEQPSVRIQKPLDKNLESSTSNNVNENVASTSNEKPPVVVDESSDKNLATSSKLEQPAQDNIDNSKQVPEEQANLNKPSGSRERLTSLIKSIMNMGFNSSDSILKGDNSVPKNNNRSQGKKKRDRIPERRSEEDTDKRDSLPPRTLNVRKGSKIKRVDSY